MINGQGKFLMDELDVALVDVDEAFVVLQTKALRLRALADDLTEVCSRGREIVTNMRDKRPTETKKPETDIEKPAPIPVAKGDVELPQIPEGVRPKNGKVAA